MYRNGHVGWNALLYAPVVPVVSHYWSLELALWGALLAILTATLPDTDGWTRRIPHRGVTHTVWFAIAAGVATGAATALVGFEPPTAAFWFGFVVGTASVLAHLAGDVLTPMGISPLLPISNAHVTFDRFKSKNRRINRALLFVGTTALLASTAFTIGLSGGTLATPGVVVA